MKRYKVTVITSTANIIAGIVDETEIQSVADALSCDTTYYLPNHEEGGYILKIELVTSVVVVE